jgi:hypothetical protein
MGLFNSHFNFQAYLGGAQYWSRVERLVKGYGSSLFGLFVSYSDEEKSLLTYRSGPNIIKLHAAVIY